jgi:hypothetical protein
MTDLRHLENHHHLRQHHHPTFNKKVVVAQGIATLRHLCDTTRWRSGARRMF